MESDQFKSEVLPLREQLFKYAQRLLNDVEETEDAIQDVFLKLWYMREGLEKYDNLAAFVTQVTKNYCLNRLKIMERTAELPEFPIPDTENTPDIQLEQKDRVDHVMKIIDRLPTLQQMILRMKHIDGYEMEEIAEITGSSPEAIRMNLSRARRKVKEIFLKTEQ